MLRLTLFVMVFAIAACGKKQQVPVLPVDLLEVLSQGEAHPSFSGSPGTAVEKLIDARVRSGEPLHFDLRSGDVSEPLGDGSCQNHVFVSVNKGEEAFIGIRLKLHDEMWHIAGYWTPSKEDGVTSDR